MSESFLKGSIWPEDRSVANVYNSYYELMVSVKYS